MTDMQAKPITVIADDKIVSVAGEVYKVSMGFPAELHAMRWTPAAASNLRGYIERKVGDSHHFQEFSNVEPYVKAWEIAKAEADRLSEKVKTDAAEARRAAERESMRAQEESQRKARETQMAWEEEQKARALKTADEIKTKAAEQAKAMEVQTAQGRVEQEKWAVLNAALTELGASDHEVIKAMEAKLAEEGRLAPDLVARRKAAREIAKAEKAKLQ